MNFKYGDLVRIKPSNNLYQISGVYPRGQSNLGVAEFVVSYGESTMRLSEDILGTMFEKYNPEKEVPLKENILEEPIQPKKRGRKKKER